MTDEVLEVADDLEVADEPVQGARRTQQLVITVIALHGRSRPLAVARLLLLLAVLGVEDSAARTALSRLKRRHVLVTHKLDGSPVYMLNPELEEVFREGDERIFALRRARPDDLWVLAAFSVPESQRHLRYKIRKILVQRGFGTVSAALWIAPQFTYEAVRRELERAHLDTFVEFFEAKSLSRDHLPAKIAEWWDLEELAARYQVFHDEFEPMLRRWEAAQASERSAAQAFADYVHVVTVWRRLPYVDPGLPRECLPDSWPGLEAESVFRRLHELLARPVFEFANSVITG